MNGSDVLKNGIRAVTAATAAIPHLGKAANAPQEKKSWFTRKNTPESKPKSWFTRKKSIDPVKESDPNPATPATDPTPTTPTEANLVKEFLQKVRKGDLTDVAKSANGEEITVFQQIKQKIKDGDFSDIVKSLPSLPPFPTTVVMQIIGSLNDIFQQNIGKVGKAVEVAVDIEIEKKNNELALTKALGEQSKKTDLKTHMPAYINHVMK
jgi:hypothetical protein